MVMALTEAQQRVKVTLNVQYFGWSLAKIRSHAYSTSLILMGKFDPKCHNYLILPLVTPDEFDEKRFKCFLLKDPTHFKGRIFSK